jgi:predicted nuclease of predicted toxin-antitoxin system
VKLLFDQNISFRVISKIKLKFPEAKQVRELGIENYSDLEIWEFAKNKGYTIVTFDGDFYDLSNFKGFPPKIIWLRFGNTKTNSIANIINSRQSIINSFINTSEYSEIACLEIK